MVWWRECHGVVEGVSWCSGGICRQGRNPLVIVKIQTTQHYLLRQTILPFLQQQPRGVTYHHDNTRFQTAKIIQNLLGGNNVNMLPWPACLINKSPI